MSAPSKSLRLGSLSHFLTEVPGRAAVEARLVEAARQAALAFFGRGYAIDAAYDPERGELELFLVLKAVEALADAKREVTLAALAPIAPEAARGEEIALPLSWGGARAPDPALQAIAPLPLSAPEFWGPLSAALAAVLAEHFSLPPSHEVPGTLGALVAADGAWLRGQSAVSGKTRLTVEGLALEELWTAPTRQLATLRAQVTLQREGSAAEARWLTWDVSGPEELDAYLSLPAAAGPTVAIPALLHAGAEQADAGERPGVDPRALLSAALAPPAAGSLWEWATNDLPRLLVGRGGRAGAWTWTLRAMKPPAHELTFGWGQVSLEVRPEEGATEDRATEEERVRIGTLSPRALTLPGPATDDQRAELAGIAGAFVERLELLIERGALSAADFPLLQILEHRLAHGPPGPPPVPPLDADGARRAGDALSPLDPQARQALLARARETPERTIGAFTAGGYQIALFDDLGSERPHSGARIVLAASSVDPTAEVLNIDRWNPETRLCIDGDAFAFRRFREWLRAGLLAGGHDAELTYSTPADDEVEEPRTPRRLKLSEWLTFDRADAEWGDRFLLDWRAQPDAVPPGQGIASFAAIHGFTAETIARLRDRGVPLWRRFLAEVVDPRFDDGGSPWSR